MADINLSKAVRSNLSSLQNTASLMAKTSDRLSTGNKVNTALDNPTNFFTASSLNSRAGDLNQLMDSMANGIKTIEAANNGLTAITKNLESMQSTLRQARQDKSFQTQSYTIDATAIGTSAVKNLSFAGGSVGTTAVDIALNTMAGAGTKAAVSATAAYAAPSAGTASTLSTSANYAAPTSPATIDFTVNGTAVSLTSSETTVALAVAKANGDLGSSNAFEAFNDSGKLGIREKVASGTALTIGGTNASLFTGTTNTGTAGGTIALTVNGTAVNLTSAQSTVALAVTKANTDLGSSSAFEAFNDSGKLGFREKVANGATLTIGGTNASLYGTPSNTGVAGAAAAVKTVDQLVTDINGSNALSGKIRATNDNGKLRIENLSTQKLDITGVGGGKIDGTTSVGEITGNTVRSDLSKQFNDLRDTLDKLADDASFNGINLLRGDNLKITFNETGSSAIDIQSKGGRAVNSTNLQIATSLTAKDLDTDSGIDTFIDQIKTALNSVRSQASAFGSNLSIVQNRQDFTKSMINTLETGAGNLTLADMNQEAANMMALQTRQSLANSTLSMANQADQGVLQLLR